MTQTHIHMMDLLRSPTIGASNAASVRPDPAHGQRFVEPRPVVAPRTSHSRTCVLPTVDDQTHQGHGAQGNARAVLLLAGRSDVTGGILAR